MKTKILLLCLVMVFLLSCVSTAIPPTEQPTLTAYKHAYNLPDTNPPALVVPVHLLETGGTGKIEMEMTK